MKKVLKWIGIVVVAFIVLGVVIGAMGGGNDSNTDSSNNNNNTSNTVGENNTEGGEEGSQLKEGTVVSGISREELENTYNERKDQSKFKADEYKDSIIGEEVVWVGRIEDVDTNPVNDTPYLNVKMGVYTVRVYDPNKEWVDLNKGTIVKIEGKISEIVELFGIDVYLEAAEVTPV